MIKCITPYFKLLNVFFFQMYLWIYHRFIDNKLIKTMKRLDGLSEKIEKDYPHLISAHVSVVRGQDWLQQVCVIY